MNERYSCKSICLLVVTLLYAMGCEAHADPGTVLIEYTSDQKMILRDAATQEPILRQDSPWHERFSWMNANTLVPLVQVVEDQDGFDLVCTFNNLSSSPKRLGSIQISQLLLGDGIRYVDHFQGFIVKEFDSSGTPLYTKRYPGSLYSPVVVAMNDRYAVGVSLQYPALEYKHDVRVVLKKTNKHGRVGYAVRFDLMSLNAGDLLDEPTIRPGESRTYTVSLRVTKRPDEWVRALLPYRTYFRQMYGSVAYDRDEYTVRGMHFAISQRLSNSNPYGYADERTRPDRHGWQPSMNKIRSVHGWDYHLFWQATGKYFVHRDFNMPSLFASPLVDRASLRGALDPSSGFPSLGREGIKHGFWWGRSGQIAQRWDPDRIELLDIRNPGHRAIALREMDIAVQAGSQIIGLDAFSHGYIRIWDAIDWVSELQARYPGVKFIIEPTANDLLHRVNPSWVTITNSEGSYVHGLPQDQWERLKSQHVLADFINPGHETVASYSFRHYRDLTGQAPSQQMIIEKVRWMASLGYSPLIYTSNSLPISVDVRESWRDTIPRDLWEDSSPGSGSSTTTPPGTGGDGSGDPPGDPPSGSDGDDDDSGDDGDGVLIENLPPLDDGSGGNGTSQNSGGSLWGLVTHENGAAGTQNAKDESAAKTRSRQVRNTTASKAPVVRARLVSKSSTGRRQVSRPSFGGSDARAALKRMKTGGRAVPRRIEKAAPERAHAAEATDSE